MTATETLIKRVEDQLERAHLSIMGTCNITDIKDLVHMQEDLAALRERLLNQQRREIAKAAPRELATLTVNVQANTEQFDQATKAIEQKLKAIAELKATIGM